MTVSITKRETDYSQWYQEVIAAADLAEHAPAVKGSMIIKPYGYALWENLQHILDEKIKATGALNAYFPLLIPESFINREKSHVEGFSPECAVVTHAGGKLLEEPLVVRPTSETIIYDAFSRWIHSYRDLPLVINQWANIVRWEMRPRLFLRTTEFLWQEGHTAHATEVEANERALQMLEIYRQLSEDYLAIPVIKGQKSESEKFAGAATTYSIEAMMQDGKALQMGTSHMLGQNFSKVFEVKFLDSDGKEKLVWISSWGVSTRLIGGIIMSHSDDQGLVLPPKVAPIQIVIIPIWSNESNRSIVASKAEAIKQELTKKGFRVFVDLREERPGPKFFEWEKKGVPLRIEVGSKEIQNKAFVVARRDQNKKETVSESVLIQKISELLIDIQQCLFHRNQERLKKNTVLIDTWKDFQSAIEKEQFILAHWDGTAETEAKIKAETKATIRNIPFDSKMEKGTCVYSEKPSQRRVLFARAY